MAIYYFTARAKVSLILHKNAILAPCLALRIF